MGRGGVGVEEEVERGGGEEGAEDEEDGGDAKSRGAIANDDGRVRFVGMG